MGKLWRRKSDELGAGFIVEDTNAVGAERGDYGWAHDVSGEHKNMETAFVLLVGRCLLNGIFLLGKSRNEKGAIEKAVVIIECFEN